MLTFSRLAGGAGRLGNQLWQIASTVGLAHARGLEVRFPDWDYRPYFNLPDELFSPVPRKAVESWTLVPHIDERAKVYLQDYNLFKDIEDQIWLWLQPSGYADSIIFDDRYAWFHELGNKVCLHVRRGDNVTHPKGIHPLRSLEYYKSALELFSDCNIIVFSDDIPWCKLNIPSVTSDTSKVFYMEGNPTRPPDSDQRAYRAAAPMDWIDLALMTHCQYHIISNSTYAWWGAFLSEDSSPIYPDNWFGWQLSYIDWRLMMPPKWREMHDETQGGVRR